MGEEIETEERRIRIVGHYSIQQCSPEDCVECKNAKWGTVIVDDLCLDCFLSDSKDHNKAVPDTVDTILFQNGLPKAARSKSGKVILCKDKDEWVRRVDDET